MVIIAAVDRSQHAKQVAAEAESLAEAFDDELHIVHVLTQSEFIELEQSSYEDTRNINDMAVVRDAAESIATAAAEDITRSYQAVGLMGSPKQRVINYTDDIDARYIVVGPRQRSPTGKVIFGSIAQSILLHSNCPVVSTVESNS